MPVYTVHVYDDGENVYDMVFSCMDDVYGYCALVGECGLQTALEISAQPSNPGYSVDCTCPHRSAVQPYTHDVRCPGAYE
jgi:hypothetical protein